MATEATSPSVGERLRRDWPWAVMLLVVVVTAGVVIIAKLTRAGYETNVGQIVYSVGEVTGHRSYVELPAGQLSVVVSKPRSSLPDYGEGTRPASSDGSFVGLDAQFRSHYALPGTAAAAAEPVARISLLVGGRTYRVPADPLDPDPTNAPIALNGTAWVAVAGRPDDVRVAIEYAGVTQILDPKTGKRTTGRAAALYTRRPTRGVTDESCGTVHLTTGFRGYNDDPALTCESESLPRVPYVVGLGWAPAGKAWVSVSAITQRLVSVERYDGGQRIGAYKAVAADVSADIRLDVPPQGPEQSEGDLDSNLLSYSPTVVSRAGTQAGFFAVAADTTQDLTAIITVTFRRLVNTDDRPDPRAPVEPTLRATWKVPVSP